MEGVEGGGNIDDGQEEGVEGDVHTLNLDNPDDLLCNPETPSDDDDNHREVDQDTLDPLRFPVGMVAFLEVVVAYLEGGEAYLAVLRMEPY